MLRDEMELTRALRVPGEGMPMPRGTANGGAAGRAGRQSGETP